MQYDSLFSVSKAIAEKMGADSTKKYDSTYSVALEILNRMGSAGGGDASKLESVDVLPTEGVKDGDVVYLKGNAEKADGFYVATLGGDGSATWTMVSGGGSSIKTYVFQALADNGTAGVSETDRAAILRDVKNGEMIRINVLNSGYSFLAIGTYYTDTRAEVNFGFAIRSNQYYKYDTSTDIVQFIGVDDMKNDIDGLNEQITNLITRTQEIDGKIGVIATDTLPTVENAGNRLFLKTDNDGYNKIYGKYHTDRVVDAPMKYETNYFEATLNITDADWEKITQGNLLKVDIMVPSISQNNHCIFEFDFKEGLNIHISDKFTYSFYIATYSDREDYDIMYKADNSVFCKMLINNDSHSIVIKSKTTDTNPFYVRTTNIQGNTLDLSQSEGVIEYEVDRVSQYMPYQDKYGNIIEGGKKLSEKYNPYHRIEANSDYKFPSWNEFGQITEGHRVYEKQFWINKSKSTNRWGYLYGEYVNEFPDLMVVPTAFGTSGQVLQSAGEGNAPTWTDLIKIQKITQDAYDALQTKDENVLYVITN